MTVSSRIALALVIGLIVGCGGAQRRVKPGQRSIGAIKLEGARSIDRDDLLGGLGLVYARETGQPFGRFLVAQDRLRIQSYYVRRGFFGATVESEVTQRGDVSDTTFTITEGARARLLRVEIEGLPADAGVTADELRALVPIDDGGVYDDEAYELAKPTLPAALAEAGYARAKVEGWVLADREHGEAVIRIKIELGPRSRFGEVKLVGVPRGLGGAVRARLRFKPGQRYSPRALEDTRSQLYEMGRFSLVRVEVDRDQTDEVADVTVTVAEAARHDLRLGGGLGMNPLNFEVRGRALYGVAAWPWPSTTVRLELRPAIVFQRDERELSPRVDAVAALDRLDFLRPRYNGAVEASFSYLALEAYTSYGPRLRLSLRTPTFLRAVQAAVGWQLGVTGYSDISRALDEDLRVHLGLERADRIGAFDQNLVVDLRDDRLVTRRGGYLELRAEEGTVAAGGAEHFLRLVPDLRGYVSAGKVTLAARARAGVITGQVPATHRFFGGGGNGYRGLPERQLSPFATSEDGKVSVPYGGTALLDLSAELRFPVLTWKEIDFGGAAFLDGGDVTEGWDALDLGHLHWATGIGVRALTIIGAIRVDGAYRLTRARGDEPRAGDPFAFHLSVGEAF